MKAWLKGGIFVPIVVLVLSVLAYLVFEAIIHPLVIFAIPGLITSLPLAPINLSTATFMSIQLSISIIVWFAIGALIGLIISKIRSRK